MFLVSQYVSGSQDSLGLCIPGVSRFYYTGQYWPDTIHTKKDQHTAEWIQNHLVLVALKCRPQEYDPLAQQHITIQWVKMLADAGEDCWQGIEHKDLSLFSRGLTNTHVAWRHLLPLTSSNEINSALSHYMSQTGVRGASTSGSGGGYALLAVDDAKQTQIKHMDGTIAPIIHIKVRYNMDTGRQAEMKA